MLGNAVWVLPFNGKSKTYENNKPDHFSSGCGILRSTRFLW